MAAGAWGAFLVTGEELELLMKDHDEKKSSTQYLNICSIDPGNRHTCATIISLEFFKGALRGAREVAEVRILDVNLNKNGLSENNGSKLDTMIEELHAKWHFKVLLVEQQFKQMSLVRMEQRLLGYGAAMAATGRIQVVERIPPGLVKKWFGTDSKSRTDDGKANYNLNKKLAVEKADELSELHNGYSMNARAEAMGISKDKVNHVADCYLQALYWIKVKFQRDQVDLESKYCESDGEGDPEVIVID